MAVEGPVPVGGQVDGRAEDRAVGQEHGDAALGVEPGDELGGLYALISTAAAEVTMYELVDSRAETLLAAAAARGVTVRVVLDPNREGGANQAAFAFLSTRGVQVRWAPSSFSATHQKTIIVDGATAAILTLNLTSRYYPTPRDFALIDTAPADVAALRQVFEADFAGTPITPHAGTVVVAPPGGWMAETNTSVNCSMNLIGIRVPSSSAQAHGRFG
ncbi:MAG: phospholipase D-like domain-containing protein [Actinomycetota bacterium]|nr:phospholipase D-like domain-containing protein [Actinomycetota bacterium]MDQ6948202.1 phospholipase D-like domain-containing protein [Actinomycetota bacterium]